MLQAALAQDPGSPSQKTPVVNDSSIPTAEVKPRRSKLVAEM